MRKVMQGAVLILGGCVGLLGFLAQVFEEHNWLMALLLAFATAAAFALGVWLIRKGKREEDSQNSQENR
jgi:cyanate permease